MQKDDISLSIDRYKASRNVSSAISKINDIGAKRFDEVGYPARRDEKYSFVDLKGIDFTNIAPSSSGDILSLKALIEREVYEECRDNFIVFRDGVFDDTLSNISSGDNISIESISELSGNSGKGFDYLVKSVKEEEEAFSILNASFLSSILTIRIRASLDKPIQIIHISSSSALSNASKGLSIICPRLFIILEKDSEAVIYEKYLTSSIDGSFFNYVKDYIIEDGAKLSLEIFQKKGQKGVLNTKPSNTYHFDKSCLHLSKKAKVSINCALTGTKLTRSHYEVYMNGEFSDFVINGISILNGEEQSHSYIKVHHKAEASTSDQVFKSIVMDKAKTSIDTTVVVYEGAMKTESAQLMQSLILSDEARSDNKPNLMIYADDVKCAHGTTVGNIDEDSIFYLKTRGISSKEARKLLLTGFVKTVIDKMQSKDLINELKDFLLFKLEV